MYAAAVCLSFIIFILTNTPQRIASDSLFSASPCSRSWRWWWKKTSHEESNQIFLVEREKKEIHTKFHSIRLFDYFWPLLWLPRLEQQFCCQFGCCFYSIRFFPFFYDSLQVFNRLFFIMLPIVVFTFSFDYFCSGLLVFSFPSLPLPHSLVHFKANWSSKENWNEVHSIACGWCNRDHWLLLICAHLF